MGFGYIFLISYWTVLVAELIGDKSIYTVASLSLRFQAERTIIELWVRSLSENASHLQSITYRHRSVIK
jgi:hypothetical protein